MLRSADFQRVLGLPPTARSSHFAAHHLPAMPMGPQRTAKQRLRTELSTGVALSCPPAVDDSPSAAADGPAPTPLTGHWLGLVVPKRHAKRAVTRNLLKRQMRQVMDAHACGLAPGLWVLRLKAPFDRQQFVSPGSGLLCTAARAELELLLGRARPRA
jgi:ribonuclease P protein component